MAKKLRIKRIKREEDKDHCAFFNDTFLKDVKIDIHAPRESGIEMCYESLIKESSNEKTSDENSSDSNEGHPFVHQSSAGNPQSNGKNINQNDECKCLDWFWNQYDRIFYNFNPKVYERAKIILDNRKKQLDDEAMDSQNQVENQLFNMENRMRICLENINSQFQNRLNAIETVLDQFTARPEK